MPPRVEAWGELDEIARRAWCRTIPIAIRGFIVGAVIGAFLPGTDSALGGSCRSSGSVSASAD